LLSPDLNGDNSLQDSGQIFKVDLIDVHKEDDIFG